MLADKAMFDIVILTDNRYVHPTTTNWYIDQDLLENQLLHTALENKGLKVCKKTGQTQALIGQKPSMQSSALLGIILTGLRSFSLGSIKQKTKLLLSILQK